MLKSIVKAAKLIKSLVGDIPIIPVFVVKKDLKWEAVEL